MNLGIRSGKYAKYLPKMTSIFDIENNIHLSSRQTQRGPQHQSACTEFLMSKLYDLQARTDGNEVS